MTNILCWSDLKSYRFSGWGGGGGVEIVLVSYKRFMLSHHARLMSNTTDVSGTSAPGKRDSLIRTENEISFLLEIFSLEDHLFFIYLFLFFFCKLKTTTNLLYQAACNNIGTSHQL